MVNQQPGFLQRGRVLNVNIICVLGFAVHLIGHINKTCQASPSTAAIPTEQSVPTAREVIVISWRREEKDGPAVILAISPG